MKRIAVTLFPFRVPLRAPLATAHGVICERRGTLVRLRDEDGVAGWGESSPLPGFGSFDEAASRRALVETAAALLRAAPSTHEEALAFIERHAPRDAAVRWGLDLALHDLAARRAGESLAARLCRHTGVSVPASVPVNALIAGATPEEIEHAARRARATNVRCVKLKVATGSIDCDVARVGAARRVLGDGVAIRLDANGGWSAGEALHAFDRLERFAPEFIEQPVAASDVAGLAHVRARTKIPVAADEAASDEASIGRLLDLGAVDLVVLKPAALGGLAPSLRAMARVLEAGVGLVVTTLLDAAIGRAGARSLAAALAEPRRACGLATAEWLADDVAFESPPVAGAITLSSGAGLGIEPEPAALARLADGAMFEWPTCS